MAALSLAALLAFTALVVNVGLYLVERRHLQNAADAAALAGTLSLAEEHQSRSLRDGPVLTSVNTMILQNQIVVGPDRQLQAVYMDAAGSPLGAVGGGGQFSPSAAGVYVMINGPFATILGSFIGSTQIQAEAQAQLTRLSFPSMLTNPLPLGVPLAAFQSAAAYDLYDQTVANTSYGVAGYVPFLDLAHVANTGGGYSPALSYGDYTVNLQYWSDGVHDSGQIGIGTRLALAGGGNAASLRAGLLDNIRAQGLVDGSGQPYALITAPLWDSYIPSSGSDPAMVQVAGYSTFKLLQSDVGLTTLRGYFVPTLASPPLPALTAGVLWGPSKTTWVK